MYAYPCMCALGSGDARPVCSCTKIFGDQKHSFEHPYAESLPQPRPHKHSATYFTHPILHSRDLSLQKHTIMSVCAGLGLLCNGHAVWSRV